MYQIEEIKVNAPFRLALLFIDGYRGQVDLNRTWYLV